MQKGLNWQIKSRESGMFETFHCQTTGGQTWTLKFFFCVSILSVYCAHLFCVSWLIACWCLCCASLCFAALFLVMFCTWFLLPSFVSQISCFCSDSTFVSAFTFDLWHNVLNKNLTSCFFPFHLTQIPARNRNANYFSFCHSLLKQHANLSSSTLMYLLWFLFPWWGLWWREYEKVIPLCLATDSRSSWGIPSQLWTIISPPGPGSALRSLSSGMCLIHL